MDPSSFPSQTSVNISVQYIGTITVGSVTVAVQVPFRCSVNKLGGYWQLFILISGPSTKFHLMGWFKESLNLM